LKWQLFFDHPAAVILGAKPAGFPELVVKPAGFSEAHLNGELIF